MKSIPGLLQDCMDKAVENKELAGVSALVIQDGEERYFAKSGFADIEKKIPVERDTIFHLYSQTKPITAAAMMLLVQDGIIDLCEPVCNFLESYKNQEYIQDGKRVKVPDDKRMRVIDLMNMTSGLVYPGMNTEAEVAAGLLMDKLVKRLETDNMMSTMEFAQELGSCPLNFVPGSHFQYGTSADVAGAVIEKVTGMRYGEFLHERLFEPLEMSDTDFYVPDEKKSRLSRIYMEKKGELTEYKGNHLGIRNDGDKNLFESGGAGLFSTLDDYSHFARMLMDGGVFRGKEIMKESAVRFLVSGKLSVYQQKDLWNWHGLEGYTYGNFMRVLENPNEAVIIGNKGEYGWDGWLGVYFMNDPATKTTFLMMTQKYDYGTGPVTRKLRNIIM